MYSPGALLLIPANPCKCKATLAIGTSSMTLRPLSLLHAHSHKHTATLLPPFATGTPSHAGFSLTSNTNRDLVLLLLDQTFTQPTSASTTSFELYNYRQSTVYHRRQHSRTFLGASSSTRIDGGVRSILGLYMILPEAGRDTHTVYTRPEQAGRPVWRKSQQP